MNNLSKAFYQAVQKGMKAADLIAEQDKKATAFAQIANAIAATGLVELKEDELIDAAEATPEKEVPKKTEAKKTETKKNTAKDSLKPGAGKAAATTPTEEKDETPAENATEADQSVNAETSDQGEVEVVEEWTEEMCTLKAESLEKLNAYTAEDAWGEDYVYNTCVPAFFEDSSIVGADNIRPTNIDGFVTYLDQLAAEFANGAQ